MFFYRSCQAKFGTKLKNRPETLVSGSGEEVPPSAHQLRGTFLVHTRLGVNISFRDFARLGIPVTLAALAGLIGWAALMN
jgi:hypothetical protein